MEAKIQAIKPTQKTAFIIGVSLLLGSMFDWLFYGKVPGVSVLIYSILVLGATYVLAKGFGYTLNRSVYGLAGGVVFFSLMVLLRANPFLAFVNSVLVLYLLTLLAWVASRPEGSLASYGVARYLEPFFRVPRRILSEFLLLVRNAISSQQGQKRGGYAPIIRGVILSLPLLFVFLLLLSSADLVFREYVTSVFDFRVNGEVVFRFALIGLVASLFAGAYALILMPAASEPEATTVSSRQVTLGATEASIILGSVGFLFFMFLLIQIRYLFGGSELITSAGYTYAQYARKGFFELIAVAVISLSMVWTIKKCTATMTVGPRPWCKWLSAVLIVEVMIIMLSAHVRLSLYEDAYGFTMLRLLSHVFILWLAVAFVLLLVHVVRNTAERSFVFPLFLSVMGFFAVINLINPDAFIARENMARLSSTNKLDTYYLSNLSEDAVPTVAGYMNHPNPEVRQKAATILMRQKESYQNKSLHWQSTNIARLRAENIFQSMISADEIDTQTR